MKNLAYERIRRHLPPLGALFLLHLLVYARLIFLTPASVPYSTIPYDFAAQYSPWLIYIGDCFKSGIFPLWSPYVGGGTPFFINPQSQLYSPLTLLIASTTGYTQRVTQLQTVFMLLFGGVGAYFLSHTLWRSRWAGFITSVCFTFTSAVFGNLEHMTITNAATLMPWLFLLTTLTAGERESPWGYPALAFFVYFLITSGYPAVIVTTLFWTFAYTLYLLYLKPAANVVKLGLLLRHGCAWLLGLCLAGAHWIPIVLNARDFTRGSPLDVDAALWGGNLYFKHFWGMFFQHMTENPLPGNDIDISMRGVYFGALALPLALAALLLVRERIVPALLFFSVGNFLMACGGMFFGRVALHILIPKLNMARFPSADSRALMVLGLVVLAGGGATLLEANHPQGRRVVFRACAGVLAVLVAGLFGFRAVVDADTYNNVVVNYITGDIIFVGLGLLALRAFSGRQLMLCLSALLALEVGTCVLANMRIVGFPVGLPRDYMALRASHRRTFTPEAANVPRRVVADNLVSIESGQAYVQKTFYLSDYNPLHLRRFDNLIANGFADWMTNGARVVALPAGSSPENYEAFRQQVRPVEYNILAYTPNRVVYRVNAVEDTLLVFNEIYFPGWRATVDGERAAVGEVSGGLRALDVRGGGHTIVLTFRPKTFYWGVGVSVVAAVLFVGWLSSTFIQSRRRRAMRTGGVEPFGVSA